MKAQQGQNKLWDGIHALLSPGLRLFLKLYYGCEIKRYPLRDNENYLILANHVNFLDPLILEVCFDRPVCLVANADFFALRGFRLLAKITPVIPIEKGTLDLAAVKKCVSWLWGGGNLALYPEGNQSFSGELCPIKPSIVKLVRLSQRPLLYFTFQGGFGIRPRFANRVRRGRMRAGVAAVRSLTEIKAMSDEELYQDIIRTLDAEEIPAATPFRSKYSAERLERLLYYCPICQEWGRLYSEGRFLRCQCCGLEAEYREDLTFACANPRFPYDTVRDWLHGEMDWVKAYHPLAGETIYQDHGVVLKRRQGKGFVKVTAGDCVLSDTAFSVGNFSVPLTEVENMVPVTAQTLTVLTKDGSYHVDGPEGFGNIKYIHMFHRLRQLRTGVDDGYYGT